MKIRILLLAIMVSMAASSVLISCSDDDEEGEPELENNFVSLESPYLICANRNPGGIGFDFEYMDEAGGGNYIDSTSVDDFAEDTFVLTIKGEKPDGSLGGAPYFKLYDNTVEAVNYSLVDTDCKGIDAFNSLNSTNIESYTLESDDASFDTSSLPTGDTGKPMMTDLLEEYDKLVIGINWKAAAYNDVANDEPIWIIKTREGVLVKMIVTDFPADPAPTSTGYIALTWDFLD